MIEGSTRAVFACGGTYGDAYVLRMMWAFVGLCITKKVFVGLCMHAS